MNSSNDKKYAIELGQCCADSEGNLFHLEQKGGGPSPEIIANHTPIVDCIRRTDDGFTVEDKIKIHALRNGKHEKAVYADKKTFRGTTPDVIFSPGCYIYPGRNHVSWYELVIFQQCEKEQTVETVYTHTGWMTTDEGKLIFLNGENGIDENGLNPNYAAELPNGLQDFKFYETHCNYHDVFMTVFDGMQRTAPDWVYIPSYAYVFLTPLNCMQRNAGKEPSFILYLIGKTGTYKSSLCKVLLNFFGRFNYASTAPITFADTTNMMERKLSLGADLLTLLDDRRPTNNYTDKITYESKEKAVSAFIGDRIGRGRMNADGSSRVTYIPRANLMITAEEAYVNIGSSSIARSLSVELSKGTIDFDGLQYLQDHPEHFNKCMQLYIKFVIGNYKTIDESRDRLLKKYRMIASDKGHARLATNFSQLMFGWHIFLMFLVDYRHISTEEMNRLLLRAQEIFLAMCDQQDKRIQEDMPTDLFISLLKEMLEIGRVYIRDLRITYSQMDEMRLANTPCVGYRDKNFIYLIPQEVYNEVYRFYSESGNTFHASRSNLWKMLMDEGKIVPKMNKKGEFERVDKPKQINGMTGRYIHLHAWVLEDEDIEGE